MTRMPAVSLVAVPGKKQRSRSSHLKSQRKKLATLPSGQKPNLHE